MVASAATTTLDLSGDPATAFSSLSSDASGTSLATLLFLNDPATLAPPGGLLDLAPGDSLSGTVSFASAVTLPASDGVGLLLLALASGDAVVGYREDLSFSLGGAPVALPAAFTLLASSSNYLAGGFLAAGVPTPDFSFDQFSYTLGITDLSDPLTLAPLSSFQFTLAPYLQLYSHSSAAAPVPEPATWMLLLSGMAAGLMSVRRRQAALARAWVSAPRER